MAAMATSTDRLSEQLIVLARRRKALLESPPTWHTRRTQKDELYRLNADIDRVLDLFLSQQRPPSGEDR